MHADGIGSDTQLLGKKIIGFPDGVIAIGHLNQHQRHDSQAARLQHLADVLVAPPRPA